MTTNKLERDLPSGDYIAGFVDGEGCFYLTYRSEKKYKRRGQPVYFRWVAYFAIVLRKDDEDILNIIRDILRCGKISYSGNSARYNVQDIRDIYTKIVPFFQKYQLRAKKKNDFDLWKRAVEIIYNRFLSNNNFTTEEQKELLSIREKMRAYKSELKRGYINSPLKQS